MTEFQRILMCFFCSLFFCQLFISFTTVLYTCHLLPRGLNPRKPWGTHGNPGGMVQFWHFFFPRGGGELFSLGNDFTAPQGNTHGICSTFGQQHIALDQSFFTPFYFISMPNFDMMLWVFILLPKEGRFFINFMPFTQRL